MATGSPLSPVPLRTQFSDKTSESGISWPWLKWLIDLYNSSVKNVVASVFGRTGVVTAQAGDYPPALGGTGQTNWQKGNLLVGRSVNVTDLLAVGADGSLLTADSSQPDGIKWSTASAAPVSSVFGRIGAVVAIPGDYGPTKGGTGQTAWVKGDLLVGQAVDTTAIQHVGADSSYLVADSTALNGIRWGSFGDAETPAGTVDGVNKIFTLAKTPAPQASLQLFLNSGGAGNYILQNGLYALAGNMITYTTAPIVGSTHLAWYRA